MINYVSIMLFIVGPVFCGLIIFATLSYLFVPIKITIPVAAIVSILVAGLTLYYNSQSRGVIDNDNKVQSQLSKSGSEQQHQLSNYQYVRTSSKNEATPRGISSTVIFIGVYIISLSIVSLLSVPNSELFIPWKEFMPIQIIQLGAAIALCFFLPGYGLVLILDSRQELDLLPKVLLGYIFSMLVTGLVAYAIAIAGVAVSDAKTILLTIHIIVLASLGLVQFKRNRFMGSRSDILFFPTSIKAFFALLKNNGSEITVFSSLIALIILYTYYLHGGIIVGDEWFHHGRSLLFMDGTFRDFAAAGSDSYPPLLSALLSGLYALSGVPSVNAYVSIHFLNIMAVFGFYYFFKKWVPPRWRRAALIGSALFALSSGFGWIYLFDITLTDGVPTSVSSAFDLLHSAGQGTSDIRLATNFIISSHPDVTTGIQIMSLPAGFALLGLIKEATNRWKYIPVFAAICTLGIFSHDEFYLFIIIASLVPLIFKLKHKNPVYAGLLAAISVSIFADVASPGDYFTVRKILSIPLIALCFLMVSVTWALYISGILYIIKDRLSIITKRIARTATLEKRIARTATLEGIKENPSGRAHDDDYKPHSRTTRCFIKFAFAIVIICIVSYFYLFTLIVWGELSPDDLSSQTEDFTVPWYMYPIKFGVVGLLGLAFVLSYMFKKFEKEVFVFGIIVIIAFATSPYYYDHRFSKYIMAGMAGFAALICYEIIIRLNALQGNRVRPLSIGLFVAFVITSAGFSTLMYIGYSAQAFENPDFGRQFYRRDFPSPSEFVFLEHLRNNVTNLRTDNIVAPGRWEDFTSKLDGFVGTSIATLDKYMKNQLTLNASSPESFYDLLNYGDIHYIILPKREYLDDNLDGKIDVGLQYPLRFALDNFQKAYEDDNFIVLTVPTNLIPPSEDGVGADAADVALVYQPQDKILSLTPSLSSSLLSGQISTITLPYNNESFKGLENESEFVKTAEVYDDNKNSSISVDGSSNSNENGSNNVTITTATATNTNSTSDNATSDAGTAVILYGDKKEKGGITLWSNPLIFEDGKIQLVEQTSEQKEEVGEDSSNSSISSSGSNNDYNNNTYDNEDTSTAINYIQAKFRVIDENDTRKNHDAGIKWTDEVNNEYYAALRNDRLELEIKQGPDNTSHNRSKQEDDTSNDNADNNNNSNDERYYFQNREIKLQNGIWYTLEVVVTQNTINVYVDNILAIKAPRILSDQSVSIESGADYDNEAGNDDDITSNRSKSITDPPPNSISRIGIRSFHNTAVFQPVVVGHISSPEIILDSANYKQEVYHHYYPVSVLALSDTKYETFAYGDYSALSKKYVILPFDPLPSNLSSSSSSSTTYHSRYYTEVQNHTINRYLEYANSGGNLVIIHSNQISAPAAYDFIDSTPSAAPYVMEKEYGEGKIIFVNAGGYFDALFDRTNNMNITSKNSSGTNDNNNQDASNPSARFIGDMKISSADEILIKSSSILLPEKIFDSYDIHLEDVNYKISDQERKNSTGGFKNVLLKDLELHGKYEVIINSTAGRLNLPSFPSNYDYFAIPIQGGFDMKIKKLKDNVDEDTIVRTGNNNNSSSSDIANSTRYTSPAASSIADVTIIDNGNTDDDTDDNDNKSDSYTQQSTKVRLADNDEITFHNIRAKAKPLVEKQTQSQPQSLQQLTSSSPSSLLNGSNDDNMAIPLIIKSPKITIINGTARFDRLYDPDRLWETLSFPPVEVSGQKIGLKLNYVDHSYEPYRKVGTRTGYITFFNWIDDGDDNPDNVFTYEGIRQAQGIQIPGDISEQAKSQGIGVPWEKAITSLNSLILLIAVVVGALITIAVYLISKRKVLREEK